MYLCYDRDADDDMGKVSNLYIIGHGLTADALIYGMSGAVRRFRDACGDPVS